jgi:hypothetical protein
MNPNNLDVVLADQVMKSNTPAVIAGAAYMSQEAVLGWKPRVNLSAVTSLCEPAVPNRSFFLTIAPK